MEQVLEHAYDQLFGKDKVESNMNDEMERLVKDLTDKHQWPFETVTPEDYLSVARPLSAMVYNLYSGKIDGEQLPAEVFYDRITHNTIEWLQCVHQMEYETMSNEIQEEIFLHYDYEFEDKAYKKRELLEQFKDYGFGLNTRALEYMEPFFEKAGLTPLFLSKESEKDYVPEQVVQRAERIFGAHETAFQTVVDRVESIVKNGLPSETALGQLADKLSGKVPEQNANQEAVKSLVRTEEERRLLMTVALHQLQKEAMQEQLKGALEEASHLREEPSPHFAIAEQNDQAIADVKKIEKETTQRERAMDPHKTVSLQRNDAGTYTLTATIEKGLRVQARAEVESVTVDYKEEHGMRSRSRTIELGSITRELYEERAKMEAVFKREREEVAIDINSSKKEKEQEKERAKEKKHTITEKSRGEISAETIKTTRMKGRRSARLELKANVSRLEHQVVKKSQFGYRTKEKKVWDAKVETLGASATVKAPTKDNLGTHTASAEAHLIKGAGTVHIKDVPISMAANMGIKSPPIGYQFDAKTARETLQDPQKLKKAVIMTAFKMLTEGMPTVEQLKENIAEKATLIDGKTSVDLGSFSISAAEMTLAKAEFNQQQEEQGLPTVDPNIKFELSSPLIESIVKDIQHIAENAPEIAEKAQSAFSAVQTQIQEAQQRFPFDMSDTPGQSYKPSYQDHADRYWDRDDFDARTL